MSATGQDLRDRGVAEVQAADNSINRQHRPAIEQAVATLAATREPFTAEDVRAALPKDCLPHSPNLLPSVFGQAAQRHEIHKIGWTRTTRSSRHSSGLPVWIGGPPQ